MRAWLGVEVPPAWGSTMQLGDGRKELGSGGDAEWPGQQEARGALGVLGEVYELLLGGGGTRRGKLTGSGRNGGRRRCLCGCDASSGVRGVLLLLYAAGSSSGREGRAGGDLEDAELGTRHGSDAVQRRGSHGGEQQGSRDEGEGVTTRSTSPCTGHVVDADLGVWPWGSIAQRAGASRRARARSRAN